MFLTCVVGIVELIPTLNDCKQGDNNTVAKKILLSIIYIGFLFGISLSVSRSWDIMRENNAIMADGIAGTHIKEYVELNKSPFDSFLSIDAEFLGLGLIILVLMLLLLFITGLLRSSDFRAAYSRLEDVLD